MTEQLLRTELPKDTVEVLEKILAKDPDWLIEEEKAFLRARASYLTSEEKRVFASALEQAEQEQTPELTKADLIAKAMQLNPELKEADLKKLNKDQLTTKISELETA